MLTYSIYYLRIVRDKYDENTIKRICILINENITRHSKLSTMSRICMCCQFLDKCTCYRIKSFFRHSHRIIVILQPFETYLHDQTESHVSTLPPQALHDVIRIQSPSQQTKKKII